jgi:pimeloyl-ACP methyl ester carboxylesterase
MPVLEASRSTIRYEQIGEGPDVVWISGGGDVGRVWHRYQLPHFRRDFRNTTFDNRGIGGTTCSEATPWPVESFARDTADLIAAVCDPPVSIVGHSMGALIAQQVAIDFPELVRSAVVLGTGADSSGWTWDYQQAEIEFRRAGGRLDGMIGVTHYAAMLYPARALGDPKIWPQLRDQLSEWLRSGENELSLIPQWEMCLTFDQRDQLPGCTVPLHVLAFEDDVQSPPRDAEEIVAITPTADLHLFEGMGHGSIFGHTHDVLNPYVEELIRRHL